MRLRRSLELTFFLSPFCMAIFLDWTLDLPGWLYPLLSFLDARLFGPWIETNRCNECNECTNSQTGTNCRQLPAAAQIRDGVLRHALQNCRASFCWHECRPRHCSGQALPCGVRRHFVGFLLVPRPSTHVPVSRRFPANGPSAPITFSRDVNPRPYFISLPPYSVSFIYRFGGDLTNVYTL